MTTHMSGPLQVGGGIIGAGGAGGAPGGRTFFVNANTSGAKNIDRPWYDVDEVTVFSTLQAAIDACVSSRGDIIYVAQGGHTVTSTVNFNKTGISVIGQAWGMNPFARGEFSAILADASFTNGPAATITSPCFIYGLGFASRDTGTTFFSGAAALIGGLATALPFGVHMKACRFPKFGLDNRIGLAIEGSSNCLIEDCDFEGVTTAFASGIYIQGAMQNLVIRGNHFRDCTNAVTMGAFAGGGPHFMLGPDNICEDSKLLDSGGNTATGLVCGNYLETATNATSYDATVATLQGQGIQFSGNHYSE